MGTGFVKGPETQQVLFKKAILMFPLQNLCHGDPSVAHWSPTCLGTNDVRITAAVIVTTPQKLSVIDVERGISMFGQLNAAWDVTTDDCG